MAQQTPRLTSFRQVSGKKKNMTHTKPAKAVRKYSALRQPNAWNEHSSSIQAQAYITQAAADKWTKSWSKKRHAVKDPELHMSEDASSRHAELTFLPLSLGSYMSARLPAPTETTAALPTAWMTRNAMRILMLLARLAIRQAIVYI